MDIRLPECPVCLEMVQMPIWSCGNGHSVCATCKTHVHACPECRNKTFARNRGVETIIAQVTVPCENRPRGCTWRARDAAHLDRHLQDCPHRLVSCVIGCSDPRIVLNELYDHVNNHHRNFIHNTSFGVKMSRCLRVTAERAEDVMIMNVSRKECFKAETVVDFDGRKMYVWVCYLGDPQRADKFLHTVTIDQRAGGKMMYTKPCTAVMLNREVYEKHEDSLILDPNKLFLKRLNQAKETISISVSITPRK